MNEQAAGTSELTLGATYWHGLSEAFKKLADEETAAGTYTRKGKLSAECEFGRLRFDAVPQADCCWVPTLESANQLVVRRGAEEHLQARFENLAKKAAVALYAKSVADYRKTAPDYKKFNLLAQHEYPDPGEPLKFWLFRLFLHLLWKESPSLMCTKGGGSLLFPLPHEFGCLGGPKTVPPRPSHERGEPSLNTDDQLCVRIPKGSITNVCTASEVFCLWLESDEREESQPALRDDPAKNAKGGKAQKKPTVFGMNIERLAKERGWSLEELGNKAGFDRSVVHRHARDGMGCTPKNKLLYAKALSKDYHTITVEELESPHQRQV